MIGLKTARALVVDDEPAEGIGLLTALARAGVGAVYLNGDVEHFPESPLRGLRLVALDMYLYGEVDPREAAQQVVHLVQSVVDKDNGPYVAITWTSDDEAAEAFKAAVASLQPSQRPLQVLSLSKTQVKEGDSYDTGVILQHVANAVAGFDALSVVVDWEQLVHEAATDTTKSLLPEAEDWPNGAADSLAALLRENVTTEQLHASPADERALRRGLLGALQPIHFDYVEQHSVRADHPAGVPQALAYRARALQMPTRQAAGLNSSLLLGPVHEGFFPGHIYLMSSVYDALAWHDRDSEEVRRGLICDLFPPPVRGEQAEDMFQTKIDLHEDASSGCVPVVVEVSPSCDLFQGKLHVGRLVAGVLVPDRYTLKKQALSIDTQPARKFLGPLNIGGVVDADSVHLALSARYVSGCDPSKVEMVPAIARLREQATNDVQAWVTSQGGRLGVLQVRSRSS